MAKKYLSTGVLLLFATITFLPLIWKVGYINDDWYLMYSARAYGTKAFIDIFSVDRPARALVMIPTYMIFGANPLYYNLSAYIFRLTSALAFLWVLRMLFPKQHHATVLASLLYLIYPGFLSQHNGIDYQSQMVSLAAAMLSIGLSINVALTKQSTGAKFVMIVLSTVFGWLYLALVEYFIGFEVLRIFSLLLLAWRDAGSPKNRIWEGVKLWAPNIFTPLAFIVWRVFFFHAERSATDVNIQFDQVKLYPIQTLYHWAVQVLQDLVDVFLSAWIVPLSQLKEYIQYWGILLAMLAVGLFLYILSISRNDEGQNASQEKILREALLLGLLVAIGGLIPIAMVNREVSFPAYSRYSLVGSVGVAIFFGAVFMMVRKHFLRNGFIAILVGVSVLTHHANTVKAVQQTALTRDFWWQVSWRVPQFEKNTTLVAYYPGIVLEEDYFIWGPANLIYYPDKQNEKYIQPALYAALLSQDTVEKIRAGERQVYDKRKNIVTYANYRNILVITQPGVNSCVHVLDGGRPEYSPDEWDRVVAAGPYSEIDHVLTDEPPHSPPTTVFGSEPARGWCYYYETADLARQQGDWDLVINIGQQAFDKNLSPTDLIEWMPFLQAYARTGDVDRLTQLAPIVSVDPYIAQQACHIFGSMPGLSVEVTSTIDSLYCLK